MFFLLLLLLLLHVSTFLQINNMKPPLHCSSSSNYNALRKTRFSPFLFALLTFIVFVVILYGEDFMCIFGQPEPLPGRPISAASESIFITISNFLRIMCLLLVDWFGFVFGLGKKLVKLPFAIGKTEEGCDVFSGRWVRDESTRPLYEESECPYIQPQLTCQEHGRPDRDYQYWRWQPHGCDLPRLVADNFKKTINYETVQQFKIFF